MLTTHPLDPTLTSGQTTDAFDQTTTVQATVNTDEISTTVQSTEASESSSSSVMTTVPSEPTSTRAQTTDARDHTSTRAQATDARDHTSTRAQTTDARDYTSTRAQTTDAPDHTSTTVQTIGASDQSSTTLQTTVASDQSSTTVQTTGASDHSSTIVQTTSDSDHTSRPMQTTGASDQTSMTVQTTGGSEYASTSVLTTGPFEPTLTILQTTDAFDQPTTTVQTTGATDEISTTVQSTRASESSSSSVMTTVPSERTSTREQTTDAPDHTSKTVQTTGASDQSSTTVQTTGASDQSPTTVQTTGAFGQTSTIVETTGASGETSMTLQTTGTSEHTSTSVLTTGPFEPTSTSMQTADTFYQTTTTVQTTGATEPSSTTTQKTDASDHTSTTVQTTGVSDQTATNMQTTGASNQTSTFVQSTGESLSSSTSILTTGPSEITSNSGQTTGAYEIITDSKQSTSESATEGLYTTLTNEGTDDITAFETKQTLVSEGMTAFKITDLETMISNTDMEGSSTNEFTSSERMTTDKDASTSYETSEGISSTNKGTGGHIPSTVVTKSESSSTSVQAATISSINTEESTGNSEESSTTRLGDSSFAETTGYSDTTRSERTTAYIEISSLNTERSTSEIISSSGRMTRAEDSSTFSVTTEKIPMTYKDTETESSTTAQTKEFSIPSTTNIQKTTISESTSTDESTGISESSVTEYITESESSTRALTTGSESSSTSQSITETTSSSESNTSEKALVTSKTTESVPEAQGSTTDGMTTPERMSSSEIESTVLTRDEIISSTDATGGPMSVQTSSLESSSVDATTVVSEAPSSILTSELNLSTTPTTVEVPTTSSLLTSANDLPFIISKGTSDIPDFTSDEENISSIRFTDFTSSLSPETEPTHISASTAVETLPTETSTPGVPVHLSTADLLETDSTQQPRSTLETTVSKGSPVDRITTPEKVTKAGTDSTAEENSTTKSPNISCSCGKCRIQDLEDCTKYSECINDEYVPEQCDVGYLFSRILERCEMAENVECDKRSEQCLESDGFFADANDCSSHVQCYHGISYRKTCPEGLFYDPVKRTCDRELNCGAKPILPTSRSLDVDCDCDYCIMGDSEDCSKYYLCLNGVAYEETCSDGLLFNSETATCDYEGSALCASQSPQCIANNGDVPFPGNCSLYYHCVGGVAYDKKCDPGFHFSSGSGQCEVACEAGCDSSLECPITSQLPICLSPDDFYPNLEDCHTFYECSEGAPKLAECTDGEHFNPVEQICQDPCQAMCDLDLDCVNSTDDFTESGTSVFTESATNSISSLATSEEMKVSVPIDVTSTIIAPTSGRKSTATESTTLMDLIPTGFYSSVHPETDPDKSITESTSRTTRYITSSYLFSDETSPTTSSSLCPEPTGIYPDPEECRALYLCIDRYPMKLYCDGHMHFNPLTKRCESPCSASCDPTLDCPTTEEPETPTPLPLSLCRTKAFLPKRGSCKYYYDCTRSKLRKKEKCPKGLQFNPTKRVCDLPQKSGCGEPAKDLPVPDLYYKCPCEACLVPSAHNCLEYFLCLDFTAYRMKCSDGLLFDKRQNTCNLANKVICDSSTTTTSTQYPSTEETYKTTTGHPYTTETFPTTKFYTTTRQPHLTSTTRQPYTASTSTSRPYTTSTTREPYTTSTSTSRPYTTSTSTKASYTTSTTSESFTTSTTREPYTTSTSTSRPYTTSTTRQPYTTSTSTKSPYTTSTTSEPFTTSTGSPYTTSTTRQPYTMSTSTSRQYTTREPYTRSTGRPYITSTTSEPYTTLTSTNRPYTTSTTTKPTSTIAPTEGPFRCPEANGMFKNPKDCGSFIHCANLMPYLKACPGGLHFNIETQNCDYPCNAKCDESLPCVASTAVPPTTANPLCPCRNCLQPNPESCTKFLECKDGQPTKKDCPKGQTFDSRISRCNWAHRGNCEHSEVCPRRNGLFPYKGDCNKFIHCSNGIPYTKVCPPRLQFDPDTMRCTFTRSPCGTTGSLNGTKGKLSPVVPSVPQWRCPGSFGYYRHEEKCHQYYHCVEGVATLKECSKGLYFNSKYGTCDWSKNVNCRASQSHLERRCRIFREDFHCPSNRSYITSPHCDMFFDCRTGKACIKSCPEGLFFNSETSMCDLPANVRCRKSDGGSYSLKRLSEICRHGYRQQAVDPAMNKCFYKCQRDKVRRYCCSTRSIYNEKKGLCERKSVFHFQPE